MKDFKQQLREYQNAIESYLREQCFIYENQPQQELFSAMRYSLLAGGKRLRPVMTMEFCRMCGVPPQQAMPFAAAVEMIHTYSLVHDDLPCMDNDDLRRGRPTNHKVYGECVATLAGDALQAEAFHSVLTAELPAENRARCAEILAGAVGLDGMCGGQYLDMLGEGKALTEQQLTDINSRKTGALLVAACQMGVAAAGGSELQLTAAGHFGAALGMAFQIRDDMLDVLSTADELGKPIGSDVQENKNTYMALMGEKGCRETVERLTEFAKGVLSEAFEDTAFLCSLADALATRNK